MARFEFRSFHSDNRVANIFGFWKEYEWRPLLPVRVLARLRSWQERDLRIDREFPGFVEVGEILNWHQTNQIEKNFAALYETYLLEQAGKASPLPSRSDTIPLQDFEKRLREAWQIMPQA